MGLSKLSLCENASLCEIIHPEMCSIHMFIFMYIKLVFHIKGFHQGLVIKQRYKLKVTWKWPIQVIRASLITIHLFHRSDNGPESCDNGVILYILCETLHCKVSTNEEIWYVLSCKPLIFKFYDFVFSAWSSVFLVLW